ncbi:putative amino acid permease YhdG [termite gut metagenome]|uniref:Putative amino acid permease YhdG n=1 Tax=termite gut metagenome TaxID=433724 RepID=A0A5J4SRC0_9ZZZZ
MYNKHISIMSIFQKKPINAMLTELNNEGEHGLRKTLNSYKLIALGLGAIIGAGLFSITGNAAAYHAGSSITISFVIAATGCCFAGLCYAEFASMLPVAGSAYTYSYATLGEFIAWVIGWDLVLEYAVASAAVSISWSAYLVKLLEGFHIHIPVELTACPWDGGIVNLPAALIVVALSLLLIKGTENSSFVNTIIVFLKIVIVLAFIIIGWKYINPENHVPYIPKNTGVWGEYGFSGILRSAAIVFFAFIGFDAVSTAAQETKNPKKSMPIGILGSLFICTILYILFSHVMTGVAHYTEFKGQSGIAPVAIAIDHMGTVGADGFIIPAYPWLNKAIIFAILAGYSSVILVMLLGQSRVFYSMSRDGLLPKSFSQVHAKFRTPYKSNLLFLTLISVFTLFVPARVAGELTSIGTLLAFVIVCAGIWVMRKKMPDVPRAFKTPLVPLVPILGIATCLFMMAFLPFDTWVRLILWMLIGHDIYVFYSSRHSKLRSNGSLSRKENRTLSFIGLGIATVLTFFTIANQLSEGWKEIVFPIILLSIAGIHIVLYSIRLIRNN